MSTGFSEHVVGIVAEYNPFHNGHAFHIREAKKRCNAPYCIAAMSGDFVQRGAPAMFDKYVRTYMALSSGADLVVEIPPLFALASAEDFASCGMALFDRMGIVSHVCFGSECGDISRLMDLARILAREPEELSEAIKMYTAMGLSYPQAREKALSRYLASRQESDDLSSYHGTGHGSGLSSSQEPGLDSALPHSQEPGLDSALPHSQEPGLDSVLPHSQEPGLDSVLPHSQEPGLDASLLSSPNNTLGVEYCKALLRMNSSMIPVTVRREGAGYHDPALSRDFSSATAIRSAILDRSREVSCSSENLHAPGCGRTATQESPAGALGIPEYMPPIRRQTFIGKDYGFLENHIPPACLEAIRTAAPMEINDFSLLLSYRLLQLSRQAEGDGTGLERFADVSRDLALRMDRHTLLFSSFEERIAALKTRQYTYSRISRCLMHILLDMTQEDMDTRKRLGYVSYIRILGFRRDSARLLSALKEASGLPLITKTAQGPRVLSPDALKQFRQDLFCSHVYQSALEQKTGIRPPNEYTRSVVIV